MDLALINARVDQALAQNRRAENIVLSMTGIIFLLGVAVIIAAFWTRNLYFAGGAVVCQLLIYWPINEVLKLRKDNLILQTLPAIVSSLPVDRAATEIVKFLEYLRERR